MDASGGVDGARQASACRAGAEATSPEPPSGALDGHRDRERRPVPLPPRARSVLIPQRAVPGGWGAGRSSKGIDDGAAVRGASRRSEPSSRRPGGITLSTMQDLSGEITLVTGASRGLGRAIAEAYARAGARVIMCARGAAALEEAAAVVRQAAREGGSAVEARVVDVRDEDGVASLVREITERWGPISVLVNNASLLGPRVPLRDYPVDVWRDVIDVNLTGPLILIRAVLPGMRAAGRGSIINVSSGTGNTARAEWG